MNLNTLLEEFKGSLKNRQDQYTEVFVNPSSKEMDQASQSPTTESGYHSKGTGNHLRFIATKDKKLYVFQPHTLHREVAKKFNIPEHPNALEGIAEKQGNAWRLVEAHDIEKIINDIVIYSGASKIAKDYLINNDWSWINKWIQINPYWNNTLKKLSKKYGFKAFTKKLITEEFKKGFKHPDTRDYIEIFTNPTAKEISDVVQELHGKKYFRFIANSEKKEIYVFSPTLVHAKASRELGNHIFPESYEMWGVAEKSGKGWKVVTSDILEYGRKFKENLANAKWNWIKKWVDISPLMAKLKNGEKTDDYKLEPMKFGSHKKVEESFNRITEEFKKGLKFNADYVEIFSNPTKKEMMSASREFRGKRYIRFISNRNASKVIIFQPNIFHDEVYNEIYKEKLGNYKEGTQLWGTAKFDEGRWIFDGSDGPIPNNFKWENLEKKGIFKNKEIDFVDRDTRLFKGKFATKTSTHPDDFNE